MGSILVTTKGTDVPLDDVGYIVIDPQTDFNLSAEISIYELQNSGDFITAITTPGNTLDCKYDPGGGAAQIVITSEAELIAQIKAEKGQPDGYALLDDDGSVPAVNLVNLNWQNSVLDKDVTDPSTLTPSDGDRYIVAVSAIGVWSGKDNQIAQWSDDASDWEYTIPTNGYACPVLDESTVYAFTGSVWTTFADYINAIAGESSSVDNAIAIWDGTSGEALKSLAAFKAQIATGFFGANYKTIDITGDSSQGGALIRLVSNSDSDASMYYSSNGAGTRFSLLGYFGFLPGGAHGIFADGSQIIIKSFGKSGDDNSQAISLATGDASESSPGSGNSGTVNIKSGDVINASGTGNSGGVTIESGDVQSGDSGDVIVQTGTSASGTRGDAKAEGENVRLIADSDVVAKLGDNAGAQKLSILDSDDAEVASIDSDGKGTYTEIAISKSGQATTSYESDGKNGSVFMDGSAGIFRVKSNDADLEVFTDGQTGSTNSNKTTVKTGITVDGNSGDLDIETGGVSGTGNSGGLSLKTGSVNSGTRGSVDVDTSNHNIKLGDNAGTNKVSIKDSDDAEVASIDSDGDIRGLNVKKANLSASSDPTTSNDSTQGYTVGSIWINTSTDSAFICMDATASNAVWKAIGGVLPENYIEDLQTEYVSASSVKINAGKCRDGANTFDIELSSPVTLDITSSGANGLDTGSEAADTWYSIHIIADSNGVNPVAGLFSTSPTTPTLPSGYDKFRRVSWIRNRADSSFRPFYELVSGDLRKNYCLCGETTRLVLSAGAATTYTSVDCSDIAPPTSRLILLSVQQLGTPTAQTSNNISGEDVLNVLAGQKEVTDFPCASDQTVAYRNSAAGGVVYIAVNGWTEVL